MKRVKGFQGGRRKLIKVAKTADTKAGTYAFADRRKKKRNQRQLWQANINAGARLSNTSYSKLMGGLKKKQVTIDRKVLALIAKDYPEVFKKIVEMAK